jgi:predicted RNase H-like HicB family nuclease
MRAHAPGPYYVYFDEESGEWVAIHLRQPTLSGVGSTPEAALKEVRIVAEEAT